MSGVAIIVVVILLCLRQLRYFLSCLCEASGSLQSTLVICTRYVYSLPQILLIYCNFSFSNNPLATTLYLLQNLTPDEKATWDSRAAQDKARYDAELATYAPPPGHDAKGVMIEDHRPRKKNKRGLKDPAAPKRASGAYVFFTNQERPQIHKEFPGIKFTEMGRVLGERWRALDNDEKKPFVSVCELVAL